MAELRGNGVACFLDRFVGLYVDLNDRERAFGVWELFLQIINSFVAILDFSTADHDLVLRAGLEESLNCLKAKSLVGAGDEDDLFC